MDFLVFNRRCAMKPLMSLTLALAAVVCTSTAASANDLVNLYNRYVAPYTNYVSPTTYGYPSGYGFDPYVGYTVNPYANVYTPYGGAYIDPYATGYGYSNVYDPYYSYDPVYVQPTRSTLRSIGNAIL